MDLAADLRFPKPPFQLRAAMLDAPPPANVLAAYVEQVCAWRERVLDYLATDGSSRELEGLTRWAREALEHYLAATWSPEARAAAAGSVFNLSSFPLSALEGAAGMRVMVEILQWRSAIVDYLGDAPTAMFGPGLDEVDAVDTFISPPRQPGMCHLCLMDVGVDKLKAHRCSLLDYVRAKWPPTPASFQRWQDQPSANE